MLGDWKVPFRALVDTTPDGMLVCDHRGILLLVNAEAERMFGYGRDELIGVSIDALVPDSVRPGHHRNISAYTGKPKVRLIGSSHLALHGRRKDGAEFPVEISLSPYTSEDGLLVIAGVRDISERKQLEADIQLATSHLVSAIEAVNDAFIMLDEDDGVLRANTAARALFGDDALVGARYGDVIRDAIARGVFDLGDLGDDASRHAGDALVARWLAYHTAPEGALDVRTATGRYLRVTERRTTDRGTVSTIADVTDLRRARELAEAASAAKSEFLSSVSHELRTPLNAILGFAQLLADDPKRPLDERQAERLDHVLRGGEHLLRLVDDVLDLSRIEDGRLAIALEPVDIADVIIAVARTLEPIARRTDITVRAAAVPDDLPAVFADRTRLLQVLMNFGSNAIKYGKPHGHVTLGVEVRAEVLRVLVEDDGIGIADDQLARVFEPFQRAGQETGPIEGTGIGLTISRRLAELMHATIGVTSERGVGSVFWIDVPRLREPAVRRVRAHELATSPLAAGPPRYTVLYVEDNPASAALMRDLVEQLASIELLVAPSAELGLPLARARLPDLILMDIHLPGMSGLEAAAALRGHEATRAIPIVGLSAAAFVEDARRATDAGLTRYLSKPVVLVELARTLEELLLR